MIEQGLDPDLPTQMFVDRMLQLEREGTQITNPEVVKEVNKEIYNQMKDLIDDNLLNSYFQRTVKSTDEFFIFRKQFTIYYTSNCYFSYLFSNQDNQLRNLKFSCKFGWVFNDLSSFEFSKEEEKKSKGSSKAITEDYTPPFRLSDNIRTFIGRSGILGLVPAVFTSCSLALRRNEDYVRAYLDLILNIEEGI